MGWTAQGLAWTPWFGASRPIHQAAWGRTLGMTTPRMALVVAAAALTLGACSSGSATKQQSDATGAEGPIKVAVANIAYDPPTLEVAVGDTVTWTNEDAGVRHTVTSGEPAGETVPGVSKGEESKPDGTFNGELADSGDTFEFTFDEAGTYAYFCEVHPSMTAEIVAK